MNLRKFTAIITILGALPVAFCSPMACAADTGNPSMEQTRVTVASRTLPLSQLGPQNLWPRFRFQSHSAPVHISADLSEDDSRGTFTDATVPLLPYLIQDNYDRQRRNGEQPVIRVENAALRATFYPTLGGRMASLYDKRASRELLFDNPVLQFANLAIRNAWFSGGVEWNGPLYGHSLLTCSPVFAGVVETPRGPIVRLYEFDRSLETTWQVDVFLPADDDRLWVHVKAINPNTHDVRFYWWTNIAVPLTRQTRVLSPADYALVHEATGNARLPFPIFDGFDGSYPANYPYAKSVFFRKPGNVKPWSVYVDGHGRGISHVSTSTLFGRKFFTWGTSQGGKHWMDYLSEPGKGDYIEIQGGVTPTQLQTRPLAANSSIEWTECISPLTMDAKAAHAADFSAASAAAGKIVDEHVPTSALDAMDAFLTAQASAPVGRLLHRGSGWGCLYEKMTGRQIGPGLKFEAVIGDEERPWSELLIAGTFSPETLSKLPRSFNVSAGWMEVLQRSAKAHGATWLHHFHLGVAELERGEFAKARDHFQAALDLKDNAPARRCMALLHVRGGDLEAAEADYLKAWSLGGNDANLAVEIADFLVHNHRFAAFDTFLKSLPTAIADHERIVLAKVRADLDKGEYAAARRLLMREFCTIREGEYSLTELWAASYIKESEARAGRKLTDAEKAKFHQEFPPPRQIDFTIK
jgi:Tfp pilus assembly protein PilF